MTDDKDDTTLTGSTDASGNDSDEIGNFDTSGLPFRFNPPPHKLSNFLLTNLGENGNASTSSFYDETSNKYDSTFAERKSGRTGFEKLRLGRIIMDDFAVSAGIIESGTRSGFRFLYNPAQVGGMLHTNTSFIPDQRSRASVVLQAGLENIQFELLLNRIPDVTSAAAVSDYLPQISKDDLKQLREQGTQYDLDFLYRCANGVHDTQSRKQTGDIGVLLPNPTRLILGPFTSRGAIVQASVSHQMFSSDMIPTLTYVTITFARFLSTTPADSDKLESYGISRADSSSSSGEGSSSGSSVKPPIGQSLTGKSVWDLARGSGFSPSEADTMTQIANVESNWNTSAFNNGMYGLWQINMLENLGPDRRKRYGLKKNDDLFDPQTNARVARGIYTGEGGYSAWSTYKSGEHRKVKIDWR